MEWVGSCSERVIILSRLKEEFNLNKKNKRDDPSLVMLIQDLVRLNQIGITIVNCLLGGTGCVSEMTTPTDLDRINISKGNSDFFLFTIPALLMLNVVF